MAVPYCNKCIMVHAIGEFVCRCDVVLTYGARVWINSMPGDKSRVINKSATAVTFCGHLVKMALWGHLTNNGAFGASTFTMIQYSNIHPTEMKTPLCQSA